jgi:hypothetical protein
MSERKPNRVECRRLFVLSRHGLVINLSTEVDKAYIFTFKESLINSEILAARGNAAIFNGLSN